jgi:CelD/BcsL family acetyltransferase involved in cellulose biosynthesis
MGLEEKLFYLNLALPRISLPDWFSRRRAKLRSYSAAEGLSTEWHDRWPECPRFAADIEKLLRAKPFASAFHTPPWQAAVARPFVRARRYRLLTVHDSEGLAGVLPLWIKSDDTVELVGAMISDYLEPLIRSGREVPVWRAFLLALADMPGARARELSLRNVRKEFVDLHALECAAATCGYTLEVDSSVNVQRVPVRASWEEFLASLGSHYRKEIRRKLRNAETRADARVVVFEKGPEVLHAVDSTLEFMRRVSGRKGLKAQWSYRPIFTHAAPALASGGWLRVYQLHLQSRVAAGVICFPSATGLLLWGTGYDEALRAWSPGIVLFSMVMRRAIEERAASFDFGRGEARYKQELGAIETPISHLTLRQAVA